MNKPDYGHNNTPVKISRPGRDKFKQCNKQLSFGSLIVSLFVLASATIVEKIFGTDTAVESIYGAWWFVALWGILAISASIYIIFTKAHLKISTFLLHASFALILTGALVTFIFAERGQLHLRQGETYESYLSESDLQEHSLPFDIRLVLFDIEYHSGTSEPADFISFLMVDGEMRKVSLNDIHKYKGYRLYQMSYDSDEMGSILMITYDPWGITITYIGYLLLALSMLWILLLKIRWKGVLCTFLSVAVVWVYISQLNPMTPILRTPMLAAHVSVIMISYALFLFMMGTSIVALISSTQQERLYRWNSTLLYPALFLLAAGIFIGAVWANISWGRYWGWDAKETWALITLIVYAIPMHKASIPVFKNRIKFHIYCIAALLTVIMTFLGVSFLLGGIHSYI